MERECNYCDNHQTINLEKNAAGKYIATNLDGTAHKHVKFGPSPASMPQQQQTLQQQTGSNAAEIRAKIEQSHQENMEASEGLRSAIVDLKDVLVSIEKLLSLYVHGQEGGE